MTQCHGSGTKAFRQQEVMGLGHGKLSCPSLKNKLHEDADNLNKENNSQIQVLAAKSRGEKEQTRERELCKRRQRARPKINWFG
jgi:hypothetical protein